MIRTIIRWLRGSQQQDQENRVRQRVAKLEHMAATRKFRTPDDLDLDPAVEYLNLSRIGDATQWDAVIFAVGGVIEQRVMLTDTDIEQFVDAGNWQRTADSYRRVDGDLRMIMQYERPRSK